MSLLETFQTNQSEAEQRQAISDDARPLSRLLVERARRDGWDEQRVRGGFVSLPELTDNGFEPRQVLNVRRCVSRVDDVTVVELLYKPLSLQLQAQPGLNYQTAELATEDTPVHYAVQLHSKQATIVVDAADKTGMPAVEARIIDAATGEIRQPTVEELKAEFGPVPVAA